MSALVGCTQAVRLDDHAALRPHLTRNYPSARDECFDATVSALQELEIPIKSQDKPTGKIETARKTYTATGYMPGSPASTRTSADGTRVKVTATPGTQLQQQQQYKYYIVVTGDPSACTVEVVRFRAWSEGKELHEVALGYARDHIWRPFFTEVEEGLSSTF